MVKISSNLNANFVVVSLNGFVGEIPISVNRATKDNVVETMSANIQKNNYQNAKDQVLVQLEATTTVMVNRKCWDALSVETLRRITDSSDQCEFALSLSILIKIMDKLFSLFLRYSLVPEK